MKIVFWILLALLLLVVAPTMAMSYAIFTVVLVRTKPEKWGRECSMPEDEVQRRIYEDGEVFEAAHLDKKRAVDIENDGFHLCGEYFDFGQKRAVIIIPGRMEGCRYSYHFAYPYERAGYNVLVIDNRSHGLSEGKYNSLGFKEYRDILAWGRFLHDTCGNESVVLHGVCIGSSTALFAMTAPDCPPYMAAMTADGMYVTFYETFKNHMIQQGRPLYPFIWEVMLYVRLLAGANVVTDGPRKRIGGMRRPILFLHSREDQFSLPDKAEILYGLCPSSEKRMVWFDHGEHSRIRITDPEAYDRAVTAYLDALEADGRVCPALGAPMTK